MSQQNIEDANQLTHDLTTALVQWQRNSGNDDPITMATGLLGFLEMLKTLSPNILKMVMMDINDESEETLTVRIEKALEKGKLSLFKTENHQLNLGKTPALTLAELLLEPQETGNGT